MQSIFEYLVDWYVLIRHRHITIYHDLLGNTGFSPGLKIEMRGPVDFFYPSFFPQSFVPRFPGPEYTCLLSPSFVP